MGFFITLHVIAAVILILIVLIQGGKEGGLGALGGSSQTLLGTSSQGNLFTKLTTVGAIIFMCTSLFLAISSKKTTKSDLFTEEEKKKAQTVVPPATPEVPAAPAPESNPK